MEWPQVTKMLICRVVTKGSGRPNLIIGDFVDYLLACHRTKIVIISIFPKGVLNISRTTHKYA